MGDIPLNAVNDVGRDVAATLEMGSVDSSGTECRFADVKAIVSTPTPQGSRLVLPFTRAGGLFEWRVTPRNRQTVAPDAHST
eukprot:190438-Pleurochrysis_carterae.AAC.4